MDESINEMIWVEDINHQASLGFNFSDGFAGVKVWLNVYYSNLTDASLYDNWTFTTN